MRYVSEEQRELRKLYVPYLKVDSNRHYYLPDDAPQEAKDAYKKVQEIIFEREKEEQEWDF